MTKPLAFLGDIPVQTFLNEYWQKKPLLIRNAFPELESPISADELAGLALEEEVESRIIVEQGQTGAWELQCGPFAEDHFSKMPKSHWTLLVQAVDHWVPEVEAMLDYFRFIPSWRLDDIMFSYAPDGGSVGPHFDQYDVFLLQTEGQRHWRLGQICDAGSTCLDDTPLHILQQFEPQPQADWVLNPGDMLYIPPQLAHWGIAQDDNCITMSVGFRAPSHGEILTEFSQEIASQLTEDQRYTDTSLSEESHPGEIPQAAIENLKAIIENQLDNPQELGNWFGRLMTSPKYEEDASPDNFDEDDYADIIEALQAGQVLERRASARLAFSIKDKTRDTATLFFDGQSQPCTIDFAKQLCDKRVLAFEDLAPAQQSNINAKLLSELLAFEVFYLAD
ncbi:cupin domain-containing protein [Maricurvus nonylphenolicus]|uniref:JmjC domain-containing protein n=1 Tax=Maricurvus nonylphenolicus TaxID=1008307 RepID=UPI0036F3F090